jgi:hypothetical protein
LGQFPGYFQAISRKGSVGEQWVVPVIDWTVLFTWQPAARLRDNMAGTGAPRTVRSCIWLAETEQAINAGSNSPGTLGDAHRTIYTDVSSRHWARRVRKGTSLPCG